MRYLCALVLTALVSFSLHAQTRWLIQLEVEGMENGLCEGIVEGLLSRIEGVGEVDASRWDGSVFIEATTRDVDPGQLAEAIESQSLYTARVVPTSYSRARIHIPRIRTRAEATEVSRSLNDVEGIFGGKVVPGTVLVEYDKEVTSPATIARIIRDRTTFQASVLDSLSNLAPSEDPSKAQTIIRVPGVTDFHTASMVSKSMDLNGILDGEVDFDDQSFLIIYRVGTVTAQRIFDAMVEVFERRVLDIDSIERPELVAVSKAGATVGVRTGPWFVIAVSAGGLGAGLALLYIIRRLRKRARV